MKHYLLLGAVGVAMLTGGCVNNFDLDMRGNLGNGFDTSDAARTGAMQPRPTPDARGVISYPTYQVAVARGGDLIDDVATRVGLSVNELAQYNAIAPGTPLREGEIIALPRRVSEDGNLTPQIIDVTPLNGGAPQVGEPIRHKVARGETAYSIARLYNVPVQSLAHWNGLDSSLTTREGQFLIIPISATSGIAPLPTSAPGTSAPGEGSLTPVPPSASDPLPDGSGVIDTPAPASQDIGPATTTARMARPVDGQIIRDYSASNDGIDIAASAGSPVMAADNGVVAAITKDTSGVPIVVIKHADNILTVYTNVTGVKVQKGHNVSRGQVIASVPAGSPSFMHFEVRNGLEAVDPNDYIN